MKKLKIISMVLVVALLLCSCGNADNSSEKDAKEETTIFVDENQKPIIGDISLELPEGYKYLHDGVSKYAIKGFSNSSNYLGLFFSMNADKSSSRTYRVNAYENWYLGKYYFEKINNIFFTIYKYEIKGDPIVGSTSEKYNDNKAFCVTFTINNIFYAIDLLYKDNNSSYDELMGILKSIEYMDKSKKMNSAHEHVVKKWKTTKKATCTKDGNKKGTCKICGLSVTKTIPSKGHKSGKWEIKKEATVYKSGTKVKRCKVCGKILKKKKYKLTGKALKQAVKSACGTYTYDQIARNPDKYKGKYAKFTGEVIQVMEDYGETTLRVDVTKTGTYYTFYEDTVYVIYEKSNKGNGRILEDDIITMYGKLAGTITYETVMGSSVTIPAFEALYIE